MMAEILTLAEIEARFADEWVLVGDPQTDDNLEVQSGRVLCHSKDRDEVYRQILTQGPARFAVLFTGTMPENTAIVL
jgi:hypothetical protein